MTGNNNNNNNIKFVPTAPKTYEVRYVENTQPSNLSKFASYLGIRTVENCGGKPCTCVSSISSQADIVASAIKATASAGGSSDIKTNTDGTVDVKYHSGK